MHTPWAIGLLLAGGMDSPASAEVCGRCHQAIFAAWKESAHARTMESRLFQDVLEMAEAEYGAAARKMCLECHAPVAGRINDQTLRLKVSWEGVTCDYCHSLRDVSTAGRNPKAVVEFSLVKSGPLKDSDSSAHGAEYSAVHASSLACISCHEYKNSLGFPVLATYSEWKSTAYAKEGRECQSCHMSRVAGQVVEPRIRRTQDAKINLHRMPGSHSLDQLTRTVKAQLTAARAGDKVQVSVEVSSVAAGHQVPTGSPMRQIVLEVLASTSGGQQFREERVYRRTVADQQGKLIQREHDAFMKAAKVVSDTRLHPNEKRLETFAFPVPPGTAATVKANLWYYYSPLATKESQKRVTFLTMSRTVR